MDQNFKNIMYAGMIYNTLWEWTRYALRSKSNLSEAITRAKKFLIIRGKLLYLILHTSTMLIALNTGMVNDTSTKLLCSLHIDRVEI